MQYSQLKQLHRDINRLDEIMDKLGEMGCYRKVIKVYGYKRNLVKMFKRFTGMYPGEFFQR